MLSMSLSYALQANTADPLEDWYEIEVILFMQPNQLATDAISSAQGNQQLKENLLVEEPRRPKTLTKAFALTPTEREILRSNSGVVDLTSGLERWFFDRQMPLSSATVSIDDADTSDGYGNFPPWLLEPDASYDPMFAAAFVPVPFSAWFSDLSLESLKPVELEIVTDGIESNTDEDVLTYDEIEQARVEALVAEYIAELERTSFVMDEDDIRLVRTGERIRRNNVNVIKHFTWHQRVTPRDDDANPVFLQIPGPNPIEGYFNISKGRYIHMDVHLWIFQDAANPDFRRPVIELEESRRMQKNDVHYFDHPRFGFLAEVVSLDLPEELQLQWDSVYESNKQRANIEHERSKY